jgi:hypothetical protein
VLRNRDFAVLKNARHKLLQLKFSPQQIFPYSPSNKSASFADSPSQQIANKSKVLINIFVNTKPQKQNPKQKTPKKSTQQHTTTKNNQRHLEALTSKSLKE